MSFHTYANSFQAVTRPGLCRIAALCRALGDPQDRLKCIHVAGTNGKGSVSENVARILRAAGYRVGKYISPNLIRVNERITVDGEPIADGSLCAILDEIEPLTHAVEQQTGLPPTQFEIWTAAAFLYFSRTACDYVVLEVGLGGELDATNVIAQNEIALITRLGMDHMQYLGNSIADVARAKSGIIKPMCKTHTVITVDQGEEPMAIIREKAERAGCSLVVAAPVSEGHDGMHERFSVGRLTDLRCGIPGFHQVENAAIAALCAMTLGIGEEAIRRGIAEARNPARFECFGDHPPVIYDGGHNENGIRALVDSLYRYFGNVPKTVVFACMRDKEIDTSLTLLGEGQTRFVFTTVKDNPRAMTAEELRARAAAIGIVGVAHEEIADAIKEAISHQELTVVCGSLYLYKDFIEAYNPK